MQQSKERNNNMTFGEVFKQRRTALGYTARKFAKAKGYDVGYISRLENGLIAPPAESSKLAALADALEYIKGTPERTDFMDLAAIARNEIPEDLRHNEAASFLQKFARSKHRRSRSQALNRPNRKVQKGLTMADNIGAEPQIPYISYSEIEQETDLFLEQYWGGSFPIDIDEFCDELGIGVIYIPGLKKQFKLDAYTTSDFKTIVVDESIINNEDQYRFCIAHELGHIVLHKEYYPSNIHDIETYLKYANGYVSGPAESQANIFASSLLIPSSELKKQLVHNFGGNIELGIDDMNLSEIAKVFTSIASHFGVSNTVLRHRIEYTFPDIIQAITNK